MSERTHDRHALDRLHKPVLVLNASFEPINVCAARRALVLILKGAASAEEHTQIHVHSARREVRLPSVIRLHDYRRIPHQTRSLSRKNILMRDRYTCQYCQKIMPAGELTLDHVMPRSRGGPTSWENLVACCGCRQEAMNSGAGTCFIETIAGRALSTTVSAADS